MFLLKIITNFTIAREHVGGSITVRLVSSLTRLELTSEGNIILFVFNEAV